MKEKQNTKKLCELCGLPKPSIFFMGFKKDHSVCQRCRNGLDPSPSTEAVVTNNRRRQVKPVPLRDTVRSGLIKISYLLKNEAYLSQVEISKYVGWNHILFRIAVNSGAIKRMLNSRNNRRSYKFVGIIDDQTIDLIMEEYRNYNKIHS